MQCAFQLLVGSEVVASNYVLSPSVEPFDHAIASGRFRWGQAVFDVRSCAEFVELKLTAWCAFAQVKETIRDFFSARHWARTNGAFNGSLCRYGAEPERTVRSISRRKRRVLADILPL